MCLTPIESLYISEQIARRANSRASPMDPSSSIEAADACVSALRDRGYPVSHAIWLVAGELVEDTDVGKFLLSLLPSSQRSAVCQSGFAQRVMECDAAGSVVCSRKDSHVVDREKMRCIARFHQLMQSRGMDVPVMPFIFQTAHGKDFSSSRFYAFLHWQDALREMLRIDFQGGIVDGGQLTPVTQIYELQSGDIPASPEGGVYRDVERVCYLIFDWEILESYYRNEEGVRRISSTRIAEVAASFPMFVYSQLLSRRYVRSEDDVHVVVKKKSRSVPGDFKHSYHFVFEIAGIPVVHHKRVCAEIVRPYIHDKTRVKQAKTLLGLTDEQLLCPVWGMDLVNHGNQAFATLLSRKSKGDPYPQLRRRIVFSGGFVKRTDGFAAWPSHGGDLPLQMEMLKTASYTIPKATAIAYTGEVVRMCMHTPLVRRVSTEAPRNRTADPCPSPEGTSDGGAPTATSRGGDPSPFGGTSCPSAPLPGWLASVLSNNGPYKMNTRMSCLGTHKEWLQSACEWSALNVAHVTHMFCPAFLCQTPPVLRVHSNNGCMVAWDAGDGADDAVYTRCPYCDMRAARDAHLEAGWVGGGWLKVTKTQLRSLTSSGMLLL